MEVRGTKRWWLLSVFHNCIVHPTMPLADALDEWGGPAGSSIARGLWWIHDNSVPDGKV